MKTSKQGNIAVPKSGFHRSRFNFAHDVNTTFSWGEIQPTQCRMLIPGSKTTLSTQSLIRLAPMVAPTFGRVRYKTYNQFVNIAEVFPNWDNMMAQEPKSTGFGTRVPMQVPSVKLGPLCANILHGARATLYFADDATAAQNGHYWTQYRAAPNVAPNSTDPNCSDWYTAYTHVAGVGKPIPAVVSDAFNSSANKVMPEVTGQPLTLGLFGAAYASLYTTTADPVILGGKHWADLCPVRRDYKSSDPNGSPYSLQDYQREVTMESADYVLEGSYEYSAGNVQYFALAVELSDFGKRLRKVFQGVGYQIDFLSNAQVSILPLLAQYKAYFDIFGLELYQGWETTGAARLIHDIENRFLTDVTSEFMITGKSALATIDNSNMGVYFLINELANEWYTDDVDYVSAHMAQLVVSPQGDVSQFISIDSVGEFKQGANVNVNAGLTGDNYTTADSQFTQQTNNPTSPNRDWEIQTSESTKAVGFINQLQHGQVDAEVLKRLYKWCNRNTILGRRVAELLRAQGLGKYVDETKSNYIGSTDTLVTISDVVSTAATEDASLGEFGGKGLQYDSTGTLTFENDSYGYWVTLAAVVPDAGYTQGLDPTTTALGKFDMYLPDFDAVGMEMTPKRSIVATNYLVSDTGDTGHYGFGFIPKMSKFKFCQNLTNGDFNRHGKRSTYLPYTLDKQLNINDYGVDAEAYKFTNLTSKIWNYVHIDKSARTYELPIAGNIWRQPTKYRFLSNYDRIFLNIGEHDDANDVHTLPSPGNSSLAGGDAVGFQDYNDDNFLGHHIYDMQTYAPMKPIEDSYGLDDMDDPTGKAGREVTSKA